MYGTIDLTGNFCRGISSFTQPFTFDISRSDQLTENQQLHAKLSMWGQKYAHLEDKMKVLKEQLVLVLQCDNTSISTSEFYHQYALKHDDKPLP